MTRINNKMNLNIYLCDCVKNEATNWKHIGNIPISRENVSKRYLTLLFYVFFIAIVYLQKLCHNGRYNCNTTLYKIIQSSIPS